MRRRWMLPLVPIVVLLGGTLPLRGQTGSTEPPEKPAKSSWWPSWMGFGGKSEPKPAEDKNAGKKGPPGPRIDVAAARARETAEWQRRDKVCLALRAIALETNDEDLAQKVDQLEQRIWSLYQQRLTELSSGNLGTGELPVGQPAAPRSRTPAAASPARAGGSGRSTVQED